MPRIDPTFSDKDLIRIYKNNLTTAERRRVENFFAGAEPEKERFTDDELNALSRSAAQIIDSGGPVDVAIINLDLYADFIDQIVQGGFPTAAEERQELLDGARELEDYLESGTLPLPVLLLLAAPIRLAVEVLRLIAAFLEPMATIVNIAGATRDSAFGLEVLQANAAIWADKV